MMPSMSSRTRNDAYYLTMKAGTLADSTLAAN